jgi:hypothetical protein
MMLNVLSVSQAAMRIRKMLAKDKEFATAYWKTLRIRRQKKEKGLLR